MTEKQKPVAWAVTACSRMFMGEFAELDAKAEALRCGGTCVAYELYSAPAVAPDVLKDAERYRWLLDNCSYSYGMQPDSPAEHGIEYQWQQGTYEERNHGIDGTIDAAIKAAMEVAND